MKISQSLIEHWQSFIPHANARELVKFTFQFDGNLYLSEWRKGKWSAPSQIESIQIESNSNHPKNIQKNHNPLARLHPNLCVGKRASEES